MKKWTGKKAGIFILFVFLAIVIYFNALRNPFHFDDAHHIQNNPAIRGVENIPSYFVDVRTFSIDRGNIGNYRPLLLMTHALNYLAGDLDPLGYHLANLAFHVASSFLIFLIVQAMLTPRSIPLNPPLVKGEIGGFEGGWGDSSSFAPLAAGLIFLTTPFNSEVVNYISARSSVMSAFFYLLAFYCWVNYRSQKPEVRSQNKSYFLPRTSYFYKASLIAFLLGLLTKESVITLPAILWLYDLYYVPDGGEDIGSKLKAQWKRLKTYIPFIFFIAIPYIALRAYLSHLAVSSHASPRSFYVNLLTQTKALVKAVSLLIYPVNLSVEHYVSESASLLEWQVLISLSLIILLLTIAVWLYYKTDAGWRLLSFFMLWFFIVLLPTTIIPLTTMLQENRAYLAGVTFAVFAAIILDKVSSAAFLQRQAGRRSYAIVSLFLVFILGAYSVVAVQRNKTWKDDITLWSDAVQKAPLAPRARHNLALAFMEKGHIQSAIVEYKKVIELDPEHKKAYYNLGNIYNKLAMTELALTNYHRAIEIDPDFYPVYNNMGMLYWKTGRSDAAIEQLKKAVSINPKYTLAHLNLGRIYEQSGEQELAQREFRTAKGLAVTSE